MKGPKLNSLKAGWISAKYNFFSNYPINDPRGQSKVGDPDGRSRWQNRLYLGFGRKDSGLILGSFGIFWGVCVNFGSFGEEGDSFNNKTGMVRYGNPVSRYNFFFVLTGNGASPSLLVMENYFEKMKFITFF